MTQEPEIAPDPTIAAARLRGKRAALGVVLVVSIAFVGSSSFQIIPAVFGARIEPIPAGAPIGSAEQRCATGILSLVRALDRAGERVSSVASAADDAEGMAALRPGLSPEWDGANDVRAACDEAQGGPSAWASLQRLRVAEQQSGRIGPDEVRSVRRDVTAHLPADLR